MKSGNVFKIFIYNTKKRAKSILVVFSFFIASLSHLYGQVDVSDTYMNNAGFNINCNYKTNGTETVSTANPGNVANVYGWSVGTVNAWTAGAAFEYGWNGNLNGATMPSSGANGASGSGQGAIGISFGWSGVVTYTQEITIPAGVYSIDYAMLFRNVTSINANLIAWIPNNGESIFSNVTTVPATGQWVNGSISFTIKEETTGTIQVGMQAFQSTSTENARVFIDYVKLMRYAVDKSNLQSLVNTANGLLSNRGNIPSGSTVYNELESEVSIAQGILNQASPSAEVVFAEENTLELKIKAVHAALFEYTIGSASIANPVSITQKILNPDFEANGGSTVNWVTGLGIYDGANAVFNGAPNPNHAMDGDPTGSTTGYQTIQNVPEGIYVVKAVARGRAETGSKMFIGGVAGNDFNSVYRVGVEVNRIGDVGGDLNFGFNRYETPYIVVPANVYDLTVGIYFEGDCGWSSVDNFELFYCGKADALIVQLKNELTILRDSPNMPSAYDKSEINTLLNTELTGENAETLAADLNKAISTLEVVIADYINPTLIDIQVNGISIPNFVPDVENYSFTLYTSSVGIPDVPVLTVTAMSQYASAPVINNASSIPGSSSITVTSGNGVQKTYTVDFTYMQISNLMNFTSTVDNITNQDLQLSGKGQHTITGTSNVLQGSFINIASPDAWIYFPNLRPSEVVAGPLNNIKVYGFEAQVGNNVRVAQYSTGAMLIPHSSTYEPLTVYDGVNLTGASMKIPVAQYYKTSQLGSMNNNIESFTLERGYMATFASNDDGTGISRVYIADKSSITINMMPDGLSNTASFVVIRPWRWVTKKGWRGSEPDARRFNATSHYDYNNAAYSTLDVEYVPMRHNPNWNAYGNFLDKFSSTHALGYNEPDNSVDDGYSPLEDAINAWPNMMSSGLRLGTPATTDGGLNWLYGFIDECDARNYRVDFVAWHFYRRGYTAQGLYNALKGVHERTGRPLWITEFNNGCNWTYDASNPVPSIQQNGITIEAFIEMMDTCSFVERYFVWDGCNEELRMTNSGNGNLYPAGIAYRDLQSDLAFSDDYYNDESIYDNTIVEKDLSKLIVAEAENYSCSYNGVIEADYAGYSGAGYINADNGLGTTITFKITADHATTAQFGINYANGGNADRAISIKVNGNEVVLILSMPVTGWSNYKSVETAFPVPEGSSEITLTAQTTDGFANLDYYYFYENVKFSSCNPVTQNITLSQGWNLVSLNVIPENKSIASIFNGLPVTAIKTMDSYWYATQTQYFNTLQSINAGEGYLVYMNASGTLTVTGDPVEETVSVPMLNGTWHLIGVPFQTATSFSEVFNSANCEVIKNFDGYWSPSGGNNSIDNFVPGKAYFVK